MSGARLVEGEEPTKELADAAEESSKWPAEETNWTEEPTEELTGERNRKSTVEPT